MKKFILSAIKVFIILFISCEKYINCVSRPTSQSGICIDSTLINDSILRYEIYVPVCGCDCITYINYCYSVKYGITSYVSVEFCNFTIKLI